MKTPLQPVLKYSIFYRIVTNFYWFVIGENEDYDKTGIVECIKIAETGFESAPQAIMQLYLAFNWGNKQPTELGLEHIDVQQMIFTGNFKYSRKERF